MSGYDWQEPYREALLEADWTKIEGRIQAAESAMKGKLQQVSQNRGGTPEEKQALEDAMHALRVLKREVAAWREKRAS